MPFPANFEDFAENEEILRRIRRNFSAIHSGPGSKAGQCA